MTEYEFVYAVQDIEAIRGAFVVCVNLLFLIWSLSMLYKGDRQYYAVEMSGILCLMPEIITAFLLVLPLVVLYVICEVSAYSFVANGIYLYTLWCFHHKIIKIMNI